MELVGLIGWLEVTLIAAAPGAVASADAGAFYAQPTRPACAPRGWLFAPVWTMLYLLIATAAWLVRVGFACALTGSTWRLNPATLG